nr:ankyrin repeat-containing protein At5g02620-like [Tanacetum cinerariifolium]
MGDELCRGRITPMNYQLIRIVDNIYQICRSKAGDTPEDTPLMEASRPGLTDMVWAGDTPEDTPLMEASRLGLTDMVWGFIECAKQTNKNLGKWDPLPLSWIHDLDYQTALRVALVNNQMEVAKLLLNYVSSPTDLTSKWLFRKRKRLYPLLRGDPKYDASIFDMLEKEQRSAWNPQTLNDDKSQERRIYFNKLDHGLLQLNNTILHIVTKFGDVNHVEDILEKHPSLIYSHNSEGETPVYVAAREGHVDVLRLMINNLKENNDSKESLFIRSKDKHNALHIAIQNHHVEVVFWLIEEVPQLANHINDFSESPLYLAAERRYHTIVKRILMKCGEKLLMGPKGKTALHAAAISNSAECITHLLNEKPDLLYVKDDEHDWMPLIHAIHHNSSLATRELLNVDPSIGYTIMSQSEMPTSPIHIAASLGHCETMEVLINKCLGCSEFIDGKGRNILHVAVESNATKVIEFVFRDESLTCLINQKDNSGNTPIHLLVASNFEMMEKVIDYRVDIHALNDEKLTPMDIASSNVTRETLIKGIAMNTNIHNETSSFAKDANIRNETSSLSPNSSSIDWYEKKLEARVKEAEAHFTIVDNLVLVATLIATASFAAAFTVPGGFDSSNGSKQGTPFLLKKSAFQAFVVTNAIAFSCACSVLLGHILLLIYRNRNNEGDETEQKYIDDRIVVLYFLTGIALVAMALAFVTGLFVVLTPSLDLYDSWKSIMKVYMQNREHERMILESVEHGPLIWPTIEENGVAKTKKYVELSSTEKIQADCDMKAINIILQGLPTDIYSLVNHHRVAKDLWEKVQLLMQVEGESSKGVEQLRVESSSSGGGVE